MESLSARQQSILNRVIDLYIDTGQPVGSKAITDGYQERYHASFSPATVRYEMGYLEEQGYLTHPHTSSGRVPTDLGYRYYVDHSLQPEDLPRNAFQELEEVPPLNMWQSGAFIHNACRLLSKLTEEVTVMLIPGSAEADLDQPERLRLLVTGTAFLLKQPEFQDIQKVREFFSFMEDEVQLKNLLAERTEGDRVSVTIGRENEVSALSECAVVSIAYFSGERRYGLIAVLGPTRMRYGRAVSCVDRMAKFLSRVWDQGGRDIYGA
ncbi:MAG: heat-inducible transcriptional repressor HrcA [Candidatus Omnitrophica bacterium]|nr:heat-inducible transcriptional repressor HrcA [Candidatus Omnitrophota bacterium]